MNSAYYLIFVITSMIFADTCGCNCKQVTARCTDKADITSVDFGPSRVGTTSIGILNTHHFRAGDVIELIPPVAGQTYGTGSRVDSLNYNDSDFPTDDPPATTSQVVATDFEVDTDVELKAFTAQIKAALSQDTKLTLTEGSRHAFAHPLDILTNQSNQGLATRILEHPDRLYVLVTGIVNGKDVNLEYKKDNNGSVDVNVLKIPGTKFKAEVTYSCSNIANIKSVAGEPKAGLAFFYTTVAVLNGKVDTVSTADLTKYSLANAVVSSDSPKQQQARF